MYSQNLFKLFSRSIMITSSRYLTNYAVLPETLQMFRNTLRDFVDKELAPNAAKSDEESKYNFPAIKKLCELGVMGVMIPEKYGGQNLGALGYAILIDELSRGCASTGTLFTLNISLFLNAILNFGSETQKEKYITPYLKGDVLGSFCLSEPNNGSDAGAASTTAKRDGNEWVINGTKMWVTNAPLDGAYIVMATSDKNLKHKGISAFIIPKDTPGITVGKPENKLGIRATPTCQVTFDNVRIPLDNILGEPGYGFKIAMQTLDAGRIGIGAQSTGIAQACVDLAVKYSGERKAFGSRINNFQGIQFKLSDMECRLESSRQLVWNASRLKDMGENIVKEAAIAKLMASETATFCADECIQILGGMGYTKDMPAERYYRDAKITHIYEGTSEIQRLVIANTLIKEYANF